MTLLTYKANDPLLTNDISAYSRSASKQLRVQPHGEVLISAVVLPERYRDK